MLIFSDSYENSDKSVVRVPATHICNSAVTLTTSERNRKKLSRKNVNFLKSLGLLVKKKK